MRNLQILLSFTVLFITTYEGASTTTATAGIRNFDVNINEILKLACGGDLYTAETLITLGRNDDDNDGHNNKNDDNNKKDIGDKKKAHIDRYNKVDIDRNNRNKESETASSLHIQSALKFILYADAKMAVKLHKIAKSANATTVPPLAGIYMCCGPASV
jgi:hypothetical protein